MELKCEKGRDNVILSNIKAAHFSYYSWKIIDQQDLEARNCVDKMPSKAQEVSCVKIGFSQKLRRK